MASQKLDLCIKEVGGEGVYWDYTWYPTHKLIRIHAGWIAHKKYFSEGVDTKDDMRTPKEKFEIMKEEMAGRIFNSLVVNGENYSYVHTAHWDLPRIKPPAEDHQHRNRLDEFLVATGHSSVYWKSGYAGGDRIYVLATFGFGQHHELFPNDHTLDAESRAEECVAKRLYINLTSNPDKAAFFNEHHEYYFEAENE
jgi:hypothetical protein